MVMKMTGPEHYEAALEWIGEAQDAAPDDRQHYREIAMVHAQLATAAAIAMTGAGSPTGSGAVVMPYGDVQAWTKAAGTD